MAAEEALNESTNTTKSDEQNGKRDRSTIDFPYGDLDDAVEVAKGVSHVGGSSCEVEQIAAHLGQPSTSGSFRQRILSSRIFGLVVSSAGKVTLTALGSKVCDSKQEKGARAESFLAVELYRQLYDKYKGTALPPVNGLEAEMVALGVARKQAAKARQVFQRSAQQAGFFWSGHDRLVLPSIKTGVEPSKDNGGEETSKRTTERAGGGDGGDSLHPLIQGLIKALPAPDLPWPVEKRKRWLQAAANNFDLIYTDADEAGDSLVIEVKKGSAK